MQNSFFTSCISCDVKGVKSVVNFGLHPPSNDFFREGEPQNQRHVLELGQCINCGLVQLLTPMPAEMVRARYAWITYNEPEGHLDQMVDDLIATMDLDQDARIVGLSYKDDTTLARFNRKGFANTYRFSLEDDIGVQEPLAGIETIQAAMTQERARILANKYDKADLLLVRHVLEHAHAPKDFLGGLARLIKPNGYMVFEMPESNKFLTSNDYSFIWEEHIAYFTERTVSRLIHNSGLDPWILKSYSYPLENSLVAIVRPTLTTHATNTLADEELDLGFGYGKRFAEIRERIHTDLYQLKNQGKRIAIFGAGHLAVKFLNLFDLKELICCVIDDNPHKAGLLMSGSGVPIRPSTSLLEDKIDLCLLSLSPESEKKVLSAQTRYLDQGGQFFSIFALSPIAYQAVTQ